MELKNLWENYKKPTPPKWRKVGDFALILIPVLSAGIGSAPDEAIGVITRYWVTFAITVLLTGVKFLTNTYTEGLPQKSE